MWHKFHNKAGFLLTTLIIFFTIVLVQASSIKIIKFELMSDLSEDFVFPEGFRWIAQLPPCNPRISEGEPQLDKNVLCRITFPSSKSNSALIEVCTSGYDHLENPTLPEKEQEGIYVFISGLEPQKYKWFDTTFNHWACNERDPMRPDEIGIYEVTLSKGKPIKIKHEWFIHLSEGIYELEPNEKMLKIIFQESDSWT